MTMSEAEKKEAEEKKRKIGELFNKEDKNKNDFFSCVEKIAKKNYEVNSGDPADAVNPFGDDKLFSCKNL